MKALNRYRWLHRLLHIPQETDIPFTRILAAAAVALLLAVMPAASSMDAARAQDVPAARPRVALVVKTLTSPFFTEMEKGARRAEAQFGIDLVVRTSTQETSIEQQIAIVEQLTRARIDAIVIAPADSYRLIPVLKKAQDAGIAIINVDNRLDADSSRRYGLADVPLISVDNQAAAYKAVKHLTAGVSVPTEAAIIDGFPGATNAEERRQGAMQAFGENRNIAIVGSEPGNWKIDDAYEAARKLFSTRPRIRLLFCANDLMALGALQYLLDARIQSVRVAGYDGLEEARRAIRQGRLVASVDHQSGRQGYLGVSYAARRLKGERLPAETMLETRIITKESLAGQGR